VNSVEIFGINLRNLRLARGLTQEALAELAGIAYRHYQDIEAGRRPGLQVATVDRLAMALGESTPHLLEQGRFAEPEAKRGKRVYRIVR
jgi:transcriptional regulator with XRE-family HTH domain